MIPACMSLNADISYCVFLIVLCRKTGVSHSVMYDALLVQQDLICKLYKIHSAKSLHPEIIFEYKRFSRRSIKSMDPINLRGMHPNVSKSPEYITLRPKCVLKTPSITSYPPVDLKDPNKHQKFFLKKSLFRGVVYCSLR